MMKKLHLNIVSPEKELFNGEVESVTLPGTMGSFSILPQHAPIVSSLGTGKLIYATDGEEHELDIQSGFVEMSNGRVAVCIEQQQAIKKLKIGDSIEKLQEYYNGATLSKKTPEPIWEGIVTKVCIPEFRCKPENPNKTSTFDYIIVDVNLVTTQEGDKKKYIEEHKKGISKLVLEKINKNRTFKRHNVPINYLKISKITLCKDRNVLQYVLELKPI